MNIAIIDGDTPVYVCAYQARDAVDITPHLADLDEFINSILQNTKADQYVGFLQGKTKSFRRELFSTYKATRPPPADYYLKWKDTIQLHLTMKWNFQFTTDNFEADDACISAACQVEAKGDTPIICGIDKDLQQREGWYYNTKSAKMEFVTKEQAFRNLLIQIMIGDTTDNVKPIRKGFGEARALESLEDSGDYIWGVFETFCWEIKDPIEAALKFSENVFQVVMKRDLNYKFTLTDVRDIKQNILN